MWGHLQLAGQVWRKPKVSVASLKYQQAPLFQADWYHWQTCTHTHNTAILPKPTCCTGECQASRCGSHEILYWTHLDNPTRSTGVDNLPIAAGWANIKPLGHQRLVVFLPSLLKAAVSFNLCVNSLSLSCQCHLIYNAKIKIKPLARGFYRELNRKQYF